MSNGKSKSKLSEVALQFNVQAKSILEDTGDSDDLFSDIKLSNNIDFIRTKTDFTDGLNILSPSILFNGKASDKFMKTGKENLNPSLNQTGKTLFNSSSPTKRDRNSKSRSIRDPRISSIILENSCSENSTENNPANQMKETRMRRSGIKVNNTGSFLTNSLGSTKSFSLRLQDSSDSLSQKIKATTSCQNSSTICSSSRCIQTTDLDRPSTSNVGKNRSTETCDSQISLDSISESANSNIVSSTSLKSQIGLVSNSKTNKFREEEIECTGPGTPLPNNRKTSSKTPTNGFINTPTSNLIDSFKLTSSIDRIIVPTNRTPITVDPSDCSLSQLHTPRTSNNESINTPKRISSSSIKRSSLANKMINTSNYKTPVRSVGLADSGRKSLPLSEIRHMKPTVFMRTSSNPNLRKSLNGKSSITDSNYDDFPPTQPISSIILNGVVAYVEIRSGREYRNRGTKAELESLGAKVENNFTKKVTHCIFQGGKMSTFARAVDWKIPVVSTLWIEACKAALEIVPVKGYAPYNIAKYKEDLILYRLRPKIRRRPATDSKVRLRQHQAANDLASRPVGEVGNVGGANASASNRNAPSQENDLIDALHSVADDVKSASNRFQQILTSPLLQKKTKSSKKSNSNVSRTINSKPNLDNTKKRKKQLVFDNAEDVSYKNKITDKENLNSNINETNDSSGVIRVSYDSDDLLVYAKKQAATSRCSAPGRLLTARKCKKLLSSSQKPSDVAENKKTVTTKNSQDAQPKAKRVSKQQKPQNTDKRVAIEHQNVDKTKKPKLKKRRLLLSSQLINTFDQDSNESNTEATPPCPYAASPIKRQKTNTAAKSSQAKLLPIAPIWSDLESDDSSTRTRRESSALFVKKEKPNPQRHVPPTVVCTSLHRNEVEVVNSMVAKLGRFSVERAVSERTTHVLTSCARRTLNLVKGIARGCWVLHVKWVYESSEAGKWLPEERFELDNFLPSVKAARVERQAFGPEFGLEVFREVGPVYVCRSTEPPAPDLAELLRLCGARVVSSARAARVVVGKSRPLSPFGRPPLVVSAKWVLDCISRLMFIDPQEYAIEDNSTP